MKAKIVEIQAQGVGQINLVVDFYNDADSIFVQRVFMLPEEKYTQMDRAAVRDFIKSEGLRYRLYDNALTNYAPLLNNEINIPTV